MGTWQSYTICGILAIILSWFTPGCRFGNEVVPQTDPDQVSGYYYSNAIKAEYCFNFGLLDGDGATPVCSDLEPIRENIPSLISVSLSNPTGLLLEDVANGYALLFDPQGDGTAFPIFIDQPTGNMGILFSFEPSAILGFQECERRFTLSAEGLLTKDTPTNEGELTVDGRLNLTFIGIDSFVGDCQEALLAVEDCYFDHTTCGGEDEVNNLELQSEIQSYYSEYIGLGVLNPEDISDIDTIGYEVRYE